MKLKIATFVLLIFAAFILGFVYLKTQKEYSKSAEVVESNPKTPEKSKQEIDPEIFSLNLGKIFDKHQDLTKLDKSKLVTIIMTGDIIPARGVNYKAAGYKDFTHPFLKTYSFLKNADLTITNLEAPLTKGCPVLAEGMTFCGDQRHVNGLKLAGIDIASLANNHSGNYGKVGVTQTQALLKENGIDDIGLGKSVYKKIKGKKYAFLAYNGVTEHFDLETIEKEIKAAKKEADTVIVLPHWGKEYTHKPLAAAGVAPEDPIAAAHMMVDAGADVVLGNHPHWYQGVELYNGRLIAYAHGNFIFDQMWSTKTTQGVVGKYTFYDGKLVDATYYPTQIYDYNQPSFLTGTPAQEILKTMKSYSW